MQDQLLFSSKDALLIAIPFVLILMVSTFRLDQIIAYPKRAVRGRRLACDMDQHGEPILRDPDGSPSGPGRRRNVSNGKSGIGHRRSADGRNRESVAA